jgi:hypothetical protein
MNIEQVNSVLVRAIHDLQDGELEGLHEWPKKNKRKQKRNILKKVIGQSPSKGNPLDTGSGIKGVIGRLKPM